MPVEAKTNRDASLLIELSPIAEQGARIFTFISENAAALELSDGNLSANVGLVSAQQVAVARRAMLEAGLAETAGFETRLVVSPAALRTIAANLEGIAAYLGYHADRDEVHLVITEPGTNSALRKEIDRRQGLKPILFQTSDAFFNLARSARSEFTVLVPFIDNEGAELLITLFSLCDPAVRRCLICRPLNEPHCGVAFMKRRDEFRAQGVAVYEYALPATLPSRRETFHAKVVLADRATYYVGSSNFMGSALERSLECGVMVRGQSAVELANVIDALKAISNRVMLAS